MTPGELEAGLAPHLTATGAAWLALAREQVAADPDTLATAFPQVGRRVGRAALSGVADAWSWTVDDAARVLLLAAAGPSAPGQLADLYRHGDSRERHGVLRALDVLAVPADLARPLVLDALRTNESPLVAAALGPGGGAVLGDDELQQAALKAAFTGLDLSRIAALPERATPELARALAGFALERVAAGRAVPESVWPLVALHPPADLLARIEAEGESAVPARAEAARAALTALGRGRMQP